MKVETTPRTVFAYVGRDRIEWHRGSHTANIYNACNENYDAFTFAWENDLPTIFDFFDALESYLDYVDSE